MSPDLAARAAVSDASTPIVPATSVAGRTLMLLVAIMTFLSCVTFGGVVLVQKSAAGWSADVGRQMTIVVRPTDGQDMQSNLRTLKALAEAAPGVGSATIISKQQSENLLRPWLGANIDLSALTIPRLVAVDLSDPAALDMAKLEKDISTIPGASLETHAAWRQQLGVMAGTMVASGVLVLVLILVATMLAVVFATRGTMSSNRGIVDVLHFIGASNGFIAGEFQGRFWRIGLSGGIAGGAAALVFFFVVGLVSGTFLPGAAGMQLSVLFGKFSLGWDGLLGLVIIVSVVAGLTGWTSRLTVKRFLTQIT